MPQSKPFKFNLNTSRINCTRHFVPGAPGHPVLDYLQRFPCLTGLGDSHQLSFAKIRRNMPQRVQINIREQSAHRRHKAFDAGVERFP